MGYNELERGKYSVIRNIYGYDQDVKEYSVSISKRLGYAQVSTTANICAHVMEEADQRNTDILADVFLKKA